MKPCLRRGRTLLYVLATLLLARTDLDYRISDFAQTMQLIAAEKVKVAPVSEVWEAGQRTPSLPAARR